MAKEKKTIIFIVEGSSDKAALENIFKKIYRRNKEIDFGFTNGDITSDPTVTIANVENRIYETVQEVIKDKKLKNSDVIQIVQIFDMDGAYIPDSAIVNGPTYAFEYSTTNISCTYPQRAIERNKGKRDISKKAYILWRGILIYISTLKHILIRMDYCRDCFGENQNYLGYVHL